MDVGGVARLRKPRMSDVASVQIICGEQHLLSGEWSLADPLEIVNVLAVRDTS